jgi:deoxycytidine triphosphate deaminase
MGRIKLTAHDGMWLTDGEIVAKIVYLGVNDKSESWYEITEEEYQKTLAETERNKKYDSN